MRQSEDSIVPEERLPKHPAIEEFIRTAGASLEEEYRQKGVSLPAGITGERLVRDFMESTTQSREAMESRRKLWGPHVDAIIRQVESELPGGRSNPEYQRIMTDRIVEWVRQHPELAP